MSNNFLNKTFNLAGLIKMSLVGIVLGFIVIGLFNLLSGSLIAFNTTTYTIEVIAIAIITIIFACIGARFKPSNTKSTVTKFFAIAPGGSAISEQITVKSFLLYALLYIGIFAVIIIVSWLSLRK